MLPKTDINSRYAACNGNVPHLQIPVFIDITTDWPGGAIIVLRTPRHTAMWSAMMDCVNEAVVERALTNHLIHKVAIWLPYWEMRITQCAKPSRWLFLRGERLGLWCGVWCSQSLWMGQICKIYKNLLKSFLSLLGLRSHEEKPILIWLLILLFFVKHFREDGRTYPLWFVYFIFFLLLWQMNFLL